MLPLETSVTARYQRAAPTRHEKPIKNCVLSGVSYASVYEQTHFRQLL